MPIAFAAPADPPAVPRGERLKVFGQDWRVPIATDWRVTRVNGEEVLRLEVARPQQANPRRPFQYALVEASVPARFTLEVDVQRKPGRGSLILVYAWQDEGRFNYVHLSDDSAEKVAVHNGIFHCYGGDRVRISAARGPASLVSDDWHSVKVTYDAAAGRVECWVNGKTSPSLLGVDLSLGEGRIGLGSFFDIANFRKFRLS